MAKEQTKGTQSNASGTPSASEAMDEEALERELSEQARVRREKLVKLQAEGRDPFAIVKFDQSHHSAEIKALFEATPAAIENKDVAIAGRMMSFRDIGKASFVDLQDRDGRIQVYVNADELGAEDYARMKTYDRGDFIGVEGQHTVEEAILYIDTFIQTPFSFAERHERRIAQLAEYEKTGLIAGHEID